MYCILKTLHWLFFFLWTKPKEEEWTNLEVKCCVGKTPLFILCVSIRLGAFRNDGYVSETIKCMFQVWLQNGSLNGQVIQRSKEVIRLYCHSQGFCLKKSFGHTLNLWSFLVANRRRSSQGHVDASHNLSSHLPFLFYVTCALPQTASCQNWCFISSHTDFFLPTLSTALC